MAQSSSIVIATSVALAPCIIGQVGVFMFCGILFFLSLFHFSSGFKVWLIVKVIVISSVRTCVVDRSKSLATWRSIAQTCGGRSIVSITPGVSCLCGVGEEVKIGFIGIENTPVGLLRIYATDVAHGWLFFRC